jgi:hypothetical protein
MAARGASAFHRRPADHHRSAGRCGPLAVTWAALLLAIAPAPLAAVVAFAPAPIARLAAVLDAAVLVAGILGGILHTGLFFVPALAAMAVAGVKLWREQP